MTAAWLMRMWECARARFFFILLISACFFCKSLFISVFGIYPHACFFFFDILYGDVYFYSFNSHWGLLRIEQRRHVSAIVASTQVFHLYFSSSCSWPCWWPSAIAFRFVDLSGSYIFWGTHLLVATQISQHSVRMNGFIRPFLPTILSWRPLQHHNKLLIQHRKPLPHRIAFAWK